ncbi:MAG: nicotinate (nicotinamide) nucleotide adenylyltransferase [Aquificae bacterium]|nr:nicotinate (nicotinamide) nucleotide adenylyltransferase [Aquificota bacterium]
MSILFFGGSFDPPHVGHLVLPRDAMERFGFEKVVFIPAYTSPFKAKEGHRASALERLEMVKLATEGVPYYSVEPYEVLKGGISYTYDTVRYLKEAYGLDRVYWLMGDDAFWSLDRWYRWRELLKDLTPVVMVRRHAPEEVKRRAAQMGIEDYLLFSSRRMEVSSTEIRERLKEGKDARFLVPDRVLEYIEKKGLYRP